MLTLVFAYVALNAITWYSSMPSYWNDLIVVLNFPQDGESHLALAKSYWNERMILPARRELLLADAFGPSVLGASTARSLLHEWETEPERLIQDYQFWLTVVKEKPDYRDGYIALSSIAYQLSRTYEARFYIRRALQIDPNYQMAKEMRSSLFSY